MKFFVSATRKLLLIALELFNGLRATTQLQSAATIFGSARFTPDNPYYKAAQEVAYYLAKTHAIITGGGPGIMEAANKGAMLAGNLSIGCSIKLPFEQSGNNWITNQVTFTWFFIRKFIMVRKSRIIIAFPGGFGTLDEFFEVLTLVQCRKQETPVTIILYGKDYWSGLNTWMRDTLSRQQTIDSDDLHLFYICDNIQEVLDVVSQQTGRQQLQPAIT